MLFIVEEKLPFRKYILQGVTVYICDLGNIRLVTTSTVLLDGGECSYTNPLTGNTSLISYSLKLPAKIKLIPYGTKPNTYEIVSDPLSVLMVGNQRADNADIEGTITDIIHDSKVNTPHHFIFDFKQRLTNGILYVCDIQGIIVNEAFTSSVPSYFSTKLKSISQNSEVVISDVTMVYGTSGTESSYGLFVADSLEEMLALDIGIGDRCYRTDLGSELVNVTGSNDSIDDWDMIGSGEGGGVSVDQVQTIVSNAVQTANNHAAIVSGNPHHVTKEEIGLGNVPNVNLVSRVETLESSSGTGEVPQSVLDHIAIVSGNPHHVTKAEVGLGLVPNTDFTAVVSLNTTARHIHDNKIILDNTTAPFTIEQANAIVASSLKTGITPEQAAAIEINTAKVGITPEQAAAIVANTAKVGITPEQTAAIVANTAKVGITPEQAAAIVANTAKVGITPEQAAAIVANTAKVGITQTQSDDIILANTHRSIISGNPHHVTKTDIGLGNVPNHDFTAEVAANTAKVGITPEQAAAIIASTAHASIMSGNPHNVTKTDIGLSLVPNTDFTNLVNLSDIHRQTISGNPHQVTKSDIGLGNVPNTDFTSDITALNNHVDVVSGNPHQVTKADVGLSNVPNIDCTNASNITTGTLPSSVLPAIAITDTFVVASEIEQLALTIQKGDIAVRTDENKNYINKTGNNATIADWQELMTPTDTVLSVNGQTGVIILTTKDIAEDTNLYYTEARVSANIDVATNTVNRHNHANKAILDATTASFTSEQAAAIIANTAKVGITLSQIDSINNSNTHIGTISGNPHHVTKADVGLGNVPNHDFTAEVAANTAKVGITVQQADAIVANTTHTEITSGNPHQVTKAEVGLGNVPNVDFTSDITISLSHVNTISGNPHNVTKADVGLGSVPNVDFTAEVAANTAHKAIVSGNPHNVTKNDVGLGLVPNHDFTAEVAANTAKVGITVQQAAAIVASTAHDAITSGNPHQVTKAEVGLGNVPNIDCTNASNITTGTLPSSVLPALAITDTHVVASEIEQLTLVVQKGDIAVRTDLSKSYVNKTGNNIDISDWQELMTPTDTVISVNGKTGVIVLTTNDIAEGINLYYTEDRVSANATVAANTAARHIHDNKAILDATTASFTIDNVDSINDANIHIATVTGNPHNVTKADVGLGNVPNHDFTAEVNANTAKVGITPEQTAAIVASTAHDAIISGNPHQVTKAEIGLGLVPNHDFTVEVAANTAHSNIITGNPHNVTKADVGLALVPNHDFTAEVAANTAKVGITPEQATAIVANTAKVGITVQQANDILSANDHRNIISGNPHNVTKAEIGLGNVPNIDCTNASNITTGTLPTSVLPALAITDTYVVSNETEHFNLTVQKGDIAVRIDLSKSFVNNTGNNTNISDWQELLTPTDTVISVNGQSGTVILTTSNISEGSRLYYTEARVSANATVAANTAARHIHDNKAILDATTASFTTEQAAAIVANTAKVGITPEQAAAIVVNSAKVGITAQQTTDILLANAHVTTVSGNPHHVTKADVGLGNVSNVDLTTDVATSIAHVNTVIGNPHNVTKAEVGLSNVPNINFTDDIATSNIHIATVTGNPHHVTKADVGLGLVPNHDFTAEVAANTAKVGITPEQAAAIVSSTAHISIITGNPHNVTKADIGLGNVPNIDCTNASNITTGTLPSSVLPALAITDTYVVANQAAQLALTVQKGDIAVRTDLSKSYVNKTGTNTVMTDWQELMTPTDTVLSVNGQVGTVVLTTSNITEGTNLYYTETRVSNNTTVAANTAARHIHGNKAILDEVTAPYTVEDSNILSLVNTHRNTVTGNPHQVTKADVGLSNVPNRDFTAEVAANTAKVGITPEQAAAIISSNDHIATVTGNPHQVTKTDVGLGNVPNHDFTAEVAANTTHRSIVSGNPHNVTKAEVGLGNVPNHDFTAEVAANTAKVGITPEQAAAIIANTAKVGITPQQATDIVSNNAHRSIISGNPHQVTKADVGLSNVPNIDCTNASNITTGTLPTSVLPSLSVVDTFVVTNETEQLALTVQKGDIAVRTDEKRSYINSTGNNATMTDWQELMTPTDTVLSVNGQVGTIVLTTTNVAEGINLYYTETRVSANADVALNTANRHSHTNKNILDNTTASFTTAHVSAINANTAKVGITPEQAAAIITNTAKVGITVQQAADIVSNNTHRSIVSGNPHNVTKAEIGLGNVPNVDFTTDIDTFNTHATSVTGNPHNVTKNDVGLGNVPNTDFTTAVASNTAHRSIVSGNPHNVTKAEIGLGNVPNHDFTAEVNANTAKVGITPEQAAAIVASTAHDAIVSGNPHQVTKTEVGLGNVPNIDCTNASNITTGTLPSSVLPALAITDTFVVANEIEQLALVVQKGDIAVRTDLSKSYVNKTGTNTAMTDWQELMTPTDTVLSVNGQVGTVVLTTSNVAEGSRLYYTEARVSANTNVAANTAARHTHANKTVLDNTTASFTTLKDTNLTNATEHTSLISGNPHNVTKNDVGLGNVPNTDFTTAVASNTAHRAIVSGNPHNVTKAEVGLGNVPNHDFTAEVAINTAKVGITPEQAAAIVANTAKVGITPEQITSINNANTHIGTISGNPHQVTKADVGLSNVPNHDFTAEVAANTAKVGITTQQAFDITLANSHRDIVSGNPHNVTKADVGLGNVPNTDFTTAIDNSNAHIATVIGNPHNVTKADIGLSNVPNIDCTNASNITTGTLPSSVLPALAITDTYVVATQAAQLALIVQKGDIAVRTDLAKSYVNKTGNNTAMTDWQELMTPTDTVLSVNGKVGTITLTTSDITEGSRLYYTEARVSANTTVAANTAARHTHANKTILDNTTASFTSEQAAAIVVNTAKVGISSQQAADIVSNTAHRQIVSGNPHNVTKNDVGLGNVPNTDFTTAVASNTAHRSIVSGNPHNVTKNDVGLGNVPNTDFTVNVASALSHIATVTGNPHQVTKADVGLGNVPNIDLSADVTANTAARHSHSNKAALDLVTGVNTGDQTNISGNAGTATKLATARTINGVSFDGSANITIAVGDVTLTGIQTLTNKTLDSVILNKGMTEQIAVMADSIIRSVNGSILTKALSANTVFTDGLSAGQSVVMHLTNGSSYTVTWPTITWVSYEGNVAPLISNNNVFVFWKIGTTLYGTLRGSF